MTGFGMDFDLTTGTSRAWYVPADGIKRLVDNDEPCSQLDRLGADFDRLFGDEEEE